MDARTKEVIAVLNQSGYSVLEINDEYFIISTFNHAEELVRFHYLKGRNITELISDQSLALHASDVSQQKIQLVEKIEKLKMIVHKYSQTYLWVLYLTG